MPVRIAHLSDLHLGPAPWLRPWDLHPKRVAGYANWIRKRRRFHRPEIAQHLASDAVGQGVDHILVSGDLTNFGLPAEHRRAARWLEALGAPNTVSAVPGNHDVYTPLVRDCGIAWWQAFYRGDVVSKDAFPFVRITRGVAIIGLNSAILTAPGVAAGRIGETQLERLAETLGELERKALFRLVMIHHPPLPGQTSYRRALWDAARLQQVLAMHGAEMVVHGHNHRTMEAWTAGPRGLIPVIGVASCSSAPDGPGEPASFNVYEIARSRRTTPNPTWTVSLTTRGLGVDGVSVTTLRERTLSTPKEAHPANAMNEKSSTGA